MKYFNGRAFSRVVDYVFETGVPQSSARGDTREIINASLALKNPRDRLVTESWRKLNFPFAIAEWLAMLTGEDRLKFFQQFISTYEEFSSDGELVDGAYGPRVFQTSDVSPYSQIELIIDMLRKDPNSRRAVMTIYDWGDLLGRGKKNTPCTLTMQFMIRDGKLIAIVNMRSNDVIRGLTNDMIVFTMIQEYVARQLDLPLGTYYHNAASLHLYAEDFKYAHFVPEGRWSVLMEKMPKLEDDDLHALYDAYVNMSGNDEDFGFYYSRLQTQYTRDLAAAGRAFILRRRELTAAVLWYRRISDYAIRRMLRPWFGGKVTLQSA